MAPRRTELRALECDVSRFLFEMYGSSKGYHVVWVAATEPQSVELQRSDRKALWSVAGHIVPEGLRDQRLAFMRVMHWIPAGEFALGVSGVPFIKEHQGQAMAGERWGIPASVGPLDKISLALAASYVGTGIPALDGLRLTSSGSGWTAFESRFREYFPDSRSAVGMSTPEAARIRLEAADAAVFNELAEQTPASARPGSRRWWRRR